MSQLFRDQYRDAIASHGAVGLFKLWLRVLADLATSSCRERLSELHNAMSKPLSQTPVVTFLTVFAISSMLIGGFLFIALKFFVPAVYSSTARVALERTKTDAAHDPFGMLTHVDRITSKFVLSQVIDELDLENWLNQQTRSAAPLPRWEPLRPGGPSPSWKDPQPAIPPPVWEALRGMLTFRYSRNSSLLEVSVLSQDRVMASEIANQIVEVYRRTSEKSPVMQTKVEVIDKAEPGLRPIRPNIPMNVFFGFILSLALAAIAFVYRFVSRRHVNSATPV